MSVYLSSTITVPLSSAYGLAQGANPHDEQVDFYLQQRLMYYQPHSAIL